MARLKLKICKLVNYTTALFFAWAIAVAAYAQPALAPQGDTASVSAEETGSTAESPVEPAAPARPLIALGPGEPAPFKGLLLSDMRFAELKAAELRVVDAEFRAKEEAELNEKLELVLNSCLELEKEGGAWYETFWAGAVAGVGLAVLVGVVGSAAEWW